MLSVDDVMGRLDELERSARRTLALVDEVRGAIAANAWDRPEPRLCPRCRVQLPLGTTVEDHLANVHDVARHAA